MCVGEAASWWSVEQWERPGLAAWRPTYASFPPLPLSAEGGMVGRDMPYKLEPADVMTLLARRHDRIIRPLSCVPE